MPKIVIYQTTPFWFVKKEYLMAKIDVYHSLLSSDRVIGWDMKLTSHPNSNASFVNNWDHLIWRRSPYLTRSSKLAFAPNWSASTMLTTRLDLIPLKLAHEISWKLPALQELITLNSLRSGYAYMCHWTTCCLMTPCHYLDQCWLLISKVLLWH